ncbi:MAG: diversity-generating retroelement protein Avd [Phycisphaerales bacterium]|nr:diversity-generating retroelement protein Avd [Phycisphaerales bacterium]
MKKTNSLPVIDRTFDLIKWYSAHVAKFPRSHRYSLGQRIEAKLYDILEGLVEAEYAEGAAKTAPLTAVNFRLEILRFLTRLSHELAVLPGKSHEFASREINEIGRMVGGWIKHAKTR